MLRVAGPVLLFFQAALPVHAALLVPYLIPYAVPSALLNPLEQLPRVWTPPDFVAPYFQHLFCAAHGLPAKWRVPRGQAPLLLPSLAPLRAVPVLRRQPPCVPSIHRSVLDAPPSFGERRQYSRPKSILHLAAARVSRFGHQPRSRLSARPQRLLARLLILSRCRGVRRWITASGEVLQIFRFNGRDEIFDSLVMGKRGPRGGFERGAQGR